MIALKKTRKMLFISSKKLFFVLNFFISLIPLFSLRQPLLPKLTGSLVMRWSRYKAPGELQVEIVENAVINIELVRLFLWE